MPFVTVEPGLRIHYARNGDAGPWVVLLMGLGASSGLWGDLPERLARGARPYRVVTIDNRGTGRSDAPSRPFLMEAMADDAVRVLDHAGIARAYVLGVSMGGMIAQHVALRHPTRVEGLGLVSTTPGMLHTGLPVPRALFSLLTYGVKSMDGEAMIANLLLAPSQRHRAAEVLLEMKALVKHENTSPASFFAQFLACALHDTGFRLHRIGAPTVVVTGDDDIVLRPRGSRVLAKRIPNARYEELKDTGHGVPFTDREVFHRLLATLESDTNERARRAA